MFFVLSKSLGLFAIPSNFLIAIGIVGVVLLCTRFVRLASWLMVTSLVLLALGGLSPLGNALILPLEQRFPRWDAARGSPDGIVVLGGSILPGISAARGAAAINDAAERITATAELARRYPHARIIVTGGSNALIFEAGDEAPWAFRQLEDLGVAPDRLTVETRSRNTLESAAYSRRLAEPKPGERWLLVTSAYHMPRAIGAFRAAGFPVEAYPVDWRTRGPIDMVRPFTSVSDGWKRTDTAIHEWIGLVAYRLTGEIDSLFPAP